MLCPDYLKTNPFLIAQRFVGQKEVPGKVSNPAILAMLKLDTSSPGDDDVSWCSAFVNYVMWLLRQPRTKSLRARSWLTIGESIQLVDAEVGFDVVVLKRGDSQAGPDIIEAPGHVGFYAGAPTGDHVPILGGNQDDSVSIKPYNVNRILGIRRVFA